MFAKSGADHRTLRCSPRWRPALHTLDDVLTEKRLDQLIATRHRSPALATRAMSAS